MDDYIQESKRESNRLYQDLIEEDSIEDTKDKDSDEEEKVISNRMKNITARTSNSRKTSTWIQENESDIEVNEKVNEVNDQEEDDIMDEWFDDDDLGYFQVEISDEKFELLEKDSFRVQKLTNRLINGMESWETAAKELEDDKSPLVSHNRMNEDKEVSTSRYDEYEEDLKTIGETIGINDTNSLQVNDAASSRREYSITTSLFEEDSAIGDIASMKSFQKVDDDNINEAIEISKLLSDKAYMTSNTQSPNKINVTKSSIDNILASSSIGGYYDEDVYQKYQSSLESIIDKTSASIIGQEHLRGVDGSMHSYFNLKVIFEPNSTGFEDREFNPPKGSIIAGRFQVKEVLGQAAFSTAYQCIDIESSIQHEEEQWVCLKVIKNKKDYFDQSIDEIKLLQLINSRGDADKFNFIRLVDFFYFKEHLFLVTELLKLVFYMNIIFFTTS